MTDFKQLDIYWVDLEPTKGAETRKLRPYVILQSDLVNVQSRTLIVAPLLPQHKPWPFAINLEPTAKIAWIKTAISTSSNYVQLIFHALERNRAGWKANISILSKKH